MAKRSQASDTAKTEVRAYFAALPNDRRKRLRELRAVIQSVAPRAVEGFSYRIPSFRLDDRPLVWYAAFKNHVSLYPMTANIKRILAKELEGYETSKGTVRLPLSRPLPVPLVKKLVKARIAEMRHRDE